MKSTFTAPLAQAAAYLLVTFLVCIDTQHLTEALIIGGNVALPGSQNGMTGVRTSAVPPLWTCKLNISTPTLKHCRVQVYFTQRLTHRQTCTFLPFWHIAFTLSQSVCKSCWPPTSQKISLTALTSIRPTEKNKKGKKGHITVMHTNLMSGRQHSGSQGWLHANATKYIAHLNSPPHLSKKNPHCTHIKPQPQNSKILSRYMCYTRQLPFKPTVGEILSSWIPVYPGTITCLAFSRNV